MKLFKDKNHPLIPVLNEWKKLNKMESYGVDSLSEIEKPLLTTLKIDGELTGIYYNNGDIELVSKTGTIRKDLPLCDELKSALKDYKEAVLIGEIYGVDNQGKMLPFNLTSSIIRTPNEEEENRIKLSIIQIISLDDKFFDTVLNSYSKVKELFSNFNLIHPMPEIKEDIMEAWDKYVLTKEYEGFVLYYPDKIVKVKTKLDFDLAIIFVEISKTHPDQMGSLGLAFMDEDENFRYAGKVGTGFKSSDRKIWLEYGQESSIRREDNKLFVKPEIVVKVEAMDVFIREAEAYDKDLNYIGELKTAILRQPVFIEIREDKKVDNVDTRLEQVPNWKSDNLEIESSIKMLSYVQYIKNHKNSKGEPAPWVIKEHNTGKILSSHKTKEEAEKHLKQIYYFKHKKGNTEVEDLHFNPDNTVIEDINKFKFPNNEYFGYYNPSTKQVYYIKDLFMQYPSKPVGNWFPWHNHPSGWSGYPSIVDLINMIEQDDKGPNYSYGNDGLYKFVITDMNKAKEEWEKLKKELDITTFREFINLHNEDKLRFGMDPLAQRIGATIKREWIEKKSMWVKEHTELNDYLKERLFEKYLNDHISSVKDSVKKIVFRYPQYIKALENVEEHDFLKKIEPERTPYIELTYKKLNGIKDLSDEEKQALFHHTKNSKHHPEYWDDSVLNVSDNPDDATQNVDASLMLDEYLLEMVADWKATADVMGNSARSWFEKQNRKRLKFTKDQIDLINKFIDTLEPQESDEEKDLIQSVEEEIKAVKLYTDFRDRADDEKVKEVYNHVISEEMEHAEEFLDTLKNTREALFMNAYFPSHPDNVVISGAKKTEKDIWNYYDSIKERMLNYLKGFDVVLKMKSDSGPIFIRHDPKTGQNIQINTLEDFDRWNNGRVIEFHRAIPSSETDLLWIDFDPHEEYDKKDIFKIISEIEDIVKDSFDVDKIETFYTGGRGYHMFIYLRSKINVDEARKQLKKLLDGISERYEKITTGIADKDEMRLDISTLHYGGSLRSPFSLNMTTGIPEKPIDITASHIMSFDKTGDQDEIIKTEYTILRELSNEGLINNNILGKLLSKTDFGKRMREETERRVRNEISKEEYKNNMIKIIEESLTSLV